MLTEDDMLIKYPTWRLRAVALDITEKVLFTLRQTKFYHRALIEVMRNKALEGAAEAIPAQSEHAKKAAKTGSQTAFKLMSDMGGITTGPKSLTLHQTNNFEGELRKLAETVVDVEAEEVD